MVKYCCVKNCNTGRRQSNEAYHMFSVPKEENLFRKWREALALGGTTLKKSHYVCEKHFSKGDIRQNTVLKDAGGNIIFQRNLQRMYLIKGTVPSIFRSGTDSIVSDHPMEVIVDTTNIVPLCYSESHEKEVPGTSRHVEPDINKYTQPAPRPSSSTDLEPLPPSVEPVYSPNDADDLFIHLFDGKIKPEFLDKSWSICMQDFPNKVIVFQQLGTLRNFDSTPWYRKQMVLDESLNAQMYVLGKLYTKMQLQSTLRNLEHAIRQFNDTRVCEGGPPSNQYRNVHLTCGYKDSSGRWRHNLCTIEVGNNSTCKSCVTLDHTLRQHLLQKKSVKRPQIVLSPSRKKKLDIIRKATRVQAQALKRSRRRLYNRELACS